MRTTLCDDLVGTNREERLKAGVSKSVARAKILKDERLPQYRSCICLNRMPPLTVPVSNLSLHR